VQHEGCRFRLVAGNEFHLGFHQAADEVDIARKPVEAGNDERRLAPLQSASVFASAGR
jgi:hypothetical protein